MTKDELKKEAFLYAKNSKDVQTFECGFDIAFKSYLASAEPREKQIQEKDKKIAELENFIKTQDRKLRQQSKELDKAIDRVEELEKENAELRKVAEFQQSSNMNTHLENKKLKEGLTVGSMWNKHLNSQNKALEEERDRYRNMTFDQREQLTTAKEIISEYMNILKGDTKNWKKTQEKAEQFLSEVTE